MDLHNLVTVEYNITYNQSRLQQVLKQLQSRIAHFDNTIKSIDQHCQKLQKNEQHNSQQLQKLKQFTIDNLRDTVNQVSVMKNGLVNYLGDEWLQQQQSKHGSPFSQLNNNFDSRLLAFNQQARKLSRKVTLMQQQLAANQLLLHEQKQTVNNSISQQKKQINKIRQSIREDINEKFVEFQKQFQDKNLKQVILKSQQQSLASIKLIEEQGESTKNQLMKTLKELKKLPTNNKIVEVGNLGQVVENNGIQKKGRKLKFDRKNFKANNSQEQACQYSEQQIEAHQQTQSSTEQIKDNLQLQSNSNELLTQNIQSLNEQSMQHAISTLRDELKAMLDAQMLQLRSGIQSLNARYQKVDSSIIYLTTIGKQQHDLITDIQSKVQDIKGEIDNSKTSLYEANERHNQILGRIIQQDEKSNKLEGEIVNLTNQFNAFMAQAEETQSYMKFKQSHSSGPVNNNRNRNSLPGGMSTPNLKDDNVIVQRLNNLTEKLSKLEQKLKINSQQSQKTLPRINSSTHLNPKNSNIPSMDLLRKDMQRSNEELNKTNERLQTLKRNLRQLEAAHSLIPKKIQKLEVDIRNVNQIQQDRLIDLIKEIINRVLTDPFNNNFTNTLKRQIHVKFLEIKYEYSSLWKDIEAKVADRAEATQLLKLKQSVESQNLQIKSLVNKKADNDDFKKGIKYLDSKVKEVYEYLKLKETQENSSQGRKYYMGKK